MLAMNNQQQTAIKECRLIGAVFAILFRTFLLPIF
jgi:hypothetical protein